MSKSIDIIGKHVGRLIVLREDTKRPPVFTLRKERHTPQKIKFYICECKCGNMISVRKNLLMNGKKQTKSCGCLQREIIGNIGKKCKFPVGVKPLNDVIYSYKTRAKRENFSFTLTRDEFTILISQPCYYCGDPPVKHSRGDWAIRNDFLVYNGIDRINSNAGYDLENVVPCCSNCNYAKSELSQKEFFTLVKKIYNKHINEMK